MSQKCSLWRLGYAVMEWLVDGHLGMLIAIMWFIYIFALLSTRSVLEVWGWRMLLWWGGIVMIAFTGLFAVRRFGKVSKRP